jgi:polysaccharide biosynthesis transport protein
MFDQENYPLDSYGKKLQRAPAGLDGMDRPYVSHVTSSYNWEQVLRVLRKNLNFVCAFAVVASAFVTLFAFYLKDNYQPVARVEIDPPGSEALSPREAESSFENNQEYLETQLQILQSDDLAMRVIRALRLDRNPEIVGEQALARYGKEAPSVDPVAIKSGNRSPQSRILMDAAERTPLEIAALRNFNNKLRVAMVRGSRLVEVSYESHDPRLAKQVTNVLVTQFIDQNFKTRYQSTMEASDWLSMQLNDLQREVERSNQAVVDYQRRYGLIEDGEKDGPTFQLVSEASHQLSGAQADRIQLEAFVQMIAAEKTESLPQIHESQIYQTITSRYAEASASLAEAKAIYGEANTNYKKLENQVDELALQRAAEEERIVTRINTSYRAAQERERLMLNSVNRLKAQLGDINEKFVRYQVLKNDAHANSELYNTLLARLKEAGLYAGLKSSNIRVVDPAAVLAKPSGPHRPLIIGVGAVLSGLFALVLAFARESFNNTIRTPDDARDWAGLPSLAIVPLITSQHGAGTKKLLPQNSGTTLGAPFGQLQQRTLPMIISTSDYSLEAESLRDLRTSLLSSQTDGQTRHPRVVLVASSAPGEGKSTIAINLALILSKNAKTCIMDGDLRSPTIADALGKVPVAGWDDVLAGNRKVEEALIRFDQYPNLSLLPVSKNRTNRAELIASGKIDELIDSLRGSFEFVVIDSPPVISYSDARILAPLTDAIVVVGRWGLTTRRALTRCVQRLQEVGGNVTGLVVNAMDYTSPDYQYYNFGYSSGNLNGYGRYKDQDGKKGGGDINEKPSARAAGA